MTEAREALARAAAWESARSAHIDDPAYVEDIWRDWLPFVDKQLTALHEAGLAVVPVEPTEAMVRIGTKLVEANNETGVPYEPTAIGVYRAMVRAAGGDNEA